MKVLIMGLGSIARKHIDALRRIDAYVELLALRSSRDADSCADVKNIYSIEEAMEECVDFVIISTPTACHERSVEMALKLNVPLFIEKPLMHTRNARRLKERVEAAAVLNYVACNLRFLEALRFLKDSLKGKRINEVNIYCGSYLPEWRPETDFRKQYSSIPEMGGGAHLDLIHEVDYTYWLFGMPQIQSRVLRSNSSLDIPAVDYANYCLGYPQFCVSIVLNYYRRDYRRTMEIVMEDETWFIDLAANRITAGDKVLFESAQRIADTYEAQMRYFVSLVAGGESKSFNSVDDACHTLDIIFPSD